MIYGSKEENSVLQLYELHPRMDGCVAIFVQQGVPALLIPILRIVYHTPLCSFSSTPIEKDTEIIV